MRFAVAQVARRRTDQLGNFVGVLELRAVHLDDRARIAKQDLRGGFHDARLARTSGAEEQQVPYGTAGRAHSGAEDLIQVHDGANAFFLPDDLVAQGVLELLRLDAAKRGIELTTLRLAGTHNATLLPAGVTLRDDCAVRRPVKLVKLHAYGGMQKAQLRHQFLPRGRRFRNIQ